MITSIRNITVFGMSQCNITTLLGMLKSLNSVELGNKIYCFLPNTPQLLTYYRISYYYYLIGLYPKLVLVEESL